MYVLAFRALPLPDFLSLVFCVRMSKQKIDTSPLSSFLFESDVGVMHRLLLNGFFLSAIIHPSLLCFAYFSWPEVLHVVLFPPHDEAKKI